MGRRVNPGCEVKPQMRCVWVEAIAGSARIHDGRAALLLGQPPLDHTLEGKSSWLRVARLHAPKSSPPAASLNSTAQGTQ